MPLQFSPLKPIFPLTLTQGWGTYDPKDYSQFGFTRHNGVDVQMAPDALVRAPYDGVVARVGFQPNGGGIFFGLLSDAEYDFEVFECKTPDGVVVNFPALKCQVLMDFLHLKSISAVQGTHYKAGDILAIQDNTGFSTGPHTHIQPRRVKADQNYYITPLDQNDANNTFDPTAFWNTMYAETFQNVQTTLAEGEVQLQKIASSSSTVQQKLTGLDSLKAWFTSLLKYFQK